ncbi:MAG: Fic/DOC family N-terminal domain-containing protein [Bacilli bacterium]|jgi:Fic family protein
MYKLPLANQFEDKDILKKLSHANNRIGELNGVIRLLPNPAIILNAIILGEAKESSEIENIVTTFDEIFKELTLKTINPAAKEVVNYRTAIKYGFEEISKKGYLSLNAIIHIHHIVEPDKGDIRVLPGTVIKNSKTGETIYTPPQGKADIMRYLDNFERYYNEETDDNLDPLIKMAVLHYQFEAIHPFYDGNGRTGRILNILFLVLNKRINQPILYLSKYVNQHKDRYYELLSAIQTDERNFRPFILFFLDAISEMCDFTIQFIDSFGATMDHASKLMKEKCPKIHEPEIIKHLFSDFYTKNEIFRERIGVSRNTATSILKELERSGFLVSEKIGKEVIYKNTFLFDLIKTW